MTVESWLIGISVAVIAIAFLILVIFLVKVLLELKKSLNNTNAIVLDVEKKLHSFDPLFKTISNVTYALEKQADSSLKHLAENEERDPKFQRTANTVLEFAEWGLVGIALLQKLRKR